MESTQISDLKELYTNMFKELEKEEWRRQVLKTLGCKIKYIFQYKNKLQTHKKKYIEINQVKMVQ